MPEYHRMLGETYGRFVVHAEHGDEHAMAYLDWMRAEAQRFDRHPDFPGGPVRQEEDPSGGSA
ncbi:sle1_018 (plasmid) [Streptomyces leeuwenhoekii]|uniref:Sle1_018 protein n=1 Tax=Streptomyces leeuwenhoekii TaxID=1437453 RepID=A0A0F7VKY8_STRLW|nr:sle1_018 [Streptomyces leeuwenhoekii]